MARKPFSSHEELYRTLEFYYRKYNSSEFIETDPVSIPHLFSSKADIEISAFMTASIAWGQRPVILSNAKKLLVLMDHAPADYILNASPAELRKTDQFVHRTFNGVDARYFILALRKIYKKHGGLESVFVKGLDNYPGDIGSAIHFFRDVFFGVKLPGRTAKHIADPLAGSSAKRINMFLRWMVRSDKSGVDFGLWKSISPALLMCPLDVHSGRIAREFGLLHRQQNDWKAVVELTSNLRQFDPEDPVRYDFSLFGLGVNQ
jgi:uncharacterized protein (TIGR02757 family)